MREFKGAEMRSRQISQSTGAVFVHCCGDWAKEIVLAIPIQSEPKVASIWDAETESLPGPSPVS